MSVSALSTASSASIWELAQTALTSQSAATSGGASLFAMQPPPQISGAAKSMSNLADLAESDPEKFQELTADMADKLRAAAEETDDEEEAAKLNEMASQFEAASESGSAEDLRPQGPPPPPGGMPPIPPTEEEEQSSNTLFGAMSSQSASGTAAAGPSDAVKALFDEFFAEVEAALG